MKLNNRLPCPKCHMLSKMYGGEDGHGRLYNYIACPRCHTRTKFFFATDQNAEAGEILARKAWAEDLLSAG